MAANSKVVIGCKLPNGIILEHPQNDKVKIELAGLNKARIIGATFVSTEVDAEFWAAWKSTYKDFPALKSGAIFEAKSADEAKGKAKDLEEQKTGFEPMPQDAMGVKKSTEEDF